MGNLLGDSLQAGAGIISTLIASRSNRKAVQETNEANKAIHDSDNQFAAEQAELARNWNSIGEEMARAQAAGVNPVSVAMANGGSNIGGSSDAQASPASPISMTPETSGSPQMMEAVADVALKVNQAITEHNSRRVKIALMEAEQKQAIASATANGASAELTAKMSKYYDLQAMDEHKLKQAQRQLTLSQRKQVDTIVRQSWLEFPAELREKFANATSAELNIGMIFKEALNLDAQTNLLREQAETEEHKQDNLDAGTHLQQAEAGLAEQKTQTEGYNTIQSKQEAGLHGQILAQTLSVMDKTAQQITSQTNLTNEQASLLFLNSLSSLLGGVGSVMPK